jgi:hypothetical protein
VFKMKKSEIIKSSVSTATAIITLSFSSFSFSGDITEYANSEWLTGAWPWLETEIRGCQMADPDGVNCGILEWTVPADDPPWTFEAGPDGAQLTVLDNWSCVDQFAVYDNGELLGLTSAPPEPPVLCYDEPQHCIDYGCSMGVFDLDEGEHAITLFVAYSESNAGTVYFRVDGDVGGPAMEVSIDIQPNKATNKIRLDESATIPVAILSHADFDARLVDQYTVQFGPDGALPVERMTRMKDVNRDGYKDIMFRFAASETGIQCGDTEASLTAVWEGESIVGTDTFTISPSSCR